MAKLTNKSEISAQKSGFRADIAGLRGVAVLLVLLCHFQIPGFGGGFIGPDIFFAISGYLITGLLVKEYASSIAARSRGRQDADGAVKASTKSRRGKISFSGFYLRRARRILPASILVVVFINVYALVNLNILQGAQIKNDSIWTLLFMANINFLRQATDYFAQNNTASPLQHYWTLAVEEQFYFVWPILFIAATRLNGLRIFGKKVIWQNRVRLAVSGLAVVSVGWLLIEFKTNPTTAYFSTFSRAWELAFGGVLSLVSAETFKTRIGNKLPQLRILAGVLIVGSVAIVTPNNFGFTLLLPVLATGFVLLTGESNSADLTYRVLANRPFVAVGAISYSLYLWHWPIFVFGQDLGLMSTMIQRIAGILLCFILSALSYRFIELFFLRIPLPKKKSVSLKKSGKSFALPAISVSLIIGVLWLFTYSGISVGKEGVQASTWVPGSSQINGESNSPGPTNIETVQASSLAAWTEKLNIALELKKIPAQLQSELQNTQILDYPWKKSMTCKSAGQLPAPADNISSVYCSTAPVAAGKKLVVMGDSFAGSLMPAVLNSVDLKKWQVVAIFRLECMWADTTPVGYRNKQHMDGCPIARTWMTKQVKELSPDLLILTEESIHPIVAAGGQKAQVWSAGVDSSLQKLTILSKKTLVVGMHPGIPTGGLSKCLTNSLGLTPGCFGDARLAGSYREVQKNLASKYSAGYLDLTPWLCVRGKCPPVIDSHIVYADSFHFTPLMSAALAPALREAYSSQNLQ